MHGGRCARHHRASRASRRSSLAPAGEKRSREPIQLLRIERVDHEAAFHHGLHHGAMGDLDGHSRQRVAARQSHRGSSLQFRKAGPAVPESSFSKDTALPIHEADWCDSEPQSIPTKNSRSSMAFLSISLLKRAATMPSGPCTGALGATPHWASIMARDRGTGPPRCSRHRGAMGCSRIPWPGSSRIDESCMMTGSPDELQLPSGFTGARSAEGKPEGSSYRRHSLSAVERYRGCAAIRIPTATAKTGTRPRLLADQRYANAYLFGAICPMGAKGTALVPPFANTRACQMHLDEISCNVVAKAHGVVLHGPRRVAQHRYAQGPKNLTIIPAALAITAAKLGREHPAIPPTKLALEPRR